MPAVLDINLAELGTISEKRVYQYQIPPELARQLAHHYLLPTHQQFQLRKPLTYSDIVRYVTICHAAICSGSLAK
jgi:hypothetical protein